MALGSANVNRQALIVERDLTGTYQVFDWVDVRSYLRTCLYVSYTMGAAESGNSVQIMVEFSDSTSFGYQQTAETISATAVTHTLVYHDFAAVSAAGTYDRFLIPIDVSGAGYMRVSVKESGVASNFGRVAIDVNFGWD